MDQAISQRGIGAETLHRLYRSYRKLPEPMRGLMRLLAMPRWVLASGLVRRAAKGRVVAGPFKGMALTLSPLSSRRLLGYVLGTQELELAEPLEEIRARGYRTILNIGAADGYYTLGLAMRCLATRVVAFEMLSELRRVIEAGAMKNEVLARVRLSGRCDVADLRRELEQSAGPALVFMDIEGGELELLDPAAVPALTSTDILVETHDFAAPGCTEAITSRFEATHDVRRYTSRTRVLADFPQGFLPLLPRVLPRLALDLMDEHRPETQHWLFMTSKRRD